MSGNKESFNTNFQLIISSTLGSIGATLGGNTLEVVKTRQIKNLVECKNLKKTNMSFNKFRSSSNINSCSTCLHSNGTMFTLKEILLKEGWINLFGGIRMQMMSGVTRVVTFYPLYENCKILVP